MSFTDGYWFAKSQLCKLRDVYDVYKDYPGFKKYLKAFALEYQFCSPFDLVKNHFLERGEKESAIYGETPLRTLATLARECELGASDCVFDLGCGRGLGLFFLSFFTGCDGVGIDLIPSFIQKSRLIHSATSSDLSLEFLCEDYCSSDLSKASCLYLYGTCLSDKRVGELIDKLHTLSPSVKIVTVSYPLTDYSSDFHLHKSWKGEFPWGSAQLYLQTRNLNFGFIS